MNNGRWKGFSAAMATAVVLGMTFTPGLALAATDTHAKFDMGRQGNHGWQGNVGGNGRTGGGWGRGGNGHGNQAGDAGNFGLGGGTDNGNGMAGSMGDDAQGSDVQLTGSLASALQQAVDKYDPQIQSEEQKAQTDLNAAEQVAATSSASATATAAEKDIEQQMSSVVTQMQSATSASELTGLVTQLQDLTRKLHASVDNQARDGADELFGRVRTAKRMIAAAERQYSDVHAAVTRVLSELSGAKASVTRRNFNMLHGLLPRYEVISRVVLARLQQVDNRLEAIAGTSSGSQSGLAATSTVTIPAATVTAGQTFTVSGVVYAATSGALANIPVTISFDGQTTSAETNAAGAFSGSVTPTTAIVNGSVTVTADGVVISTSADTGTVVASAASGLQSDVTGALSVGSSTAKAITYTVADAYGNPISGIAVNFALEHAVGSAAESTGEENESAGTLSAFSAVTNSAGQVSVTYTSSAGADADDDLMDTVIATTVPATGSTALTNDQAQFTY